MTNRSPLDDDPEEQKVARATRVVETDALFPLPESGYFIGGGMETGIAFIEARRAYIEGLWLCTVVTAVAAIERHIAADLYASGDRSVVQIEAELLFDKAAQAGRISAFERAKFGEIAKVRDDYVRFHEPGHMLDRLVEAGERGMGINEILQDDARMALTLAASYLKLNCSG